MRKKRPVVKAAVVVASTVTGGLVPAVEPAGAVIPTSVPTIEHFDPASTEERYIMDSSWLCSCCGWSSWYVGMAASRWNTSNHEGPTLYSTTSGPAAIELRIVGLGWVSYTHARSSYCGGAGSPPPPRPPSTNGVWNAQSIAITVTYQQLTTPRYGKYEDFLVPAVITYEIGHTLGLGHPSDDQVSSCPSSWVPSVMYNVTVDAYCNWGSPSWADVSALNGLYK